MAEANIYTLYSKIDDLLFLIETQIKNCERTSQKDVDSTDKLQKIILDTYMNHPENTQGPKAGRWSQYSALADRLESNMEKFSTAKGLHARCTKDLLNTSELLKQLKSALLEVPLK